MSDFDGLKARQALSDVGELLGGAIVESVVGDGSNTLWLARVFTDRFLTLKEKHLDAERALFRIKEAVEHIPEAGNVRAIIRDWEASR